MKQNKKIITALEQYYSSINTIRRDIDSFGDVPNVSDDKEFKTHIQLGEDITEPIIKTKKGKTVLREPPDEDLEKAKIDDIDMFDDKGKEIKNWSNESVIQEKEKEEEDDNGMGDIAQKHMGEENPGVGEDPNIDPSMENPDPSQMMGGGEDASGMSQDPSMMGGMGMGQEPPKTPKQIGRIFELKKIYARLLAIDSQLSSSPDEILAKLRVFVAEAIELFETLISNIDTFKDELDDIIVMFYNFLSEIYEILKKYYKKKQDEDQDEQNKKNARSLP